MNKKIWSIIVFIIVLSLLMNIKTMAINEEKICNEESTMAYDIVIEDKIVEYGEEIYISFVLNEAEGNFSASLINASFIPLDRILENENQIDIYITNNHSSGEHYFDVNIEDDDGISFSKTIYIYSDGQRDCISPSCIEESREIYFDNFIATDEELFLLGKKEEPENITYENTYYDAVKKSENFVYKNNDITCNVTRENDNIDEQLKITGKIEWIDSNGNIQPLRDNYVFVSENIKYGNDYGYVKTNQNGDFLIYISTAEWLNNGGLDLFLSIRSINDSVNVSFLGFPYVYSTPLYEYISDENTINYNILINPDKSCRSSAFEITQMMYYSREYVKEMSGEYLPQIEVLYPTISNGCYYFGLYIGMSKESYEYWDVGMHEYGHYVDDVFDFTKMIGGDHWFNEDLADYYGKEKGLKKAYSEAIATYIGISAQLYFNLENTNIQFVGDYVYNSHNGVTHNVLENGYGEGYENSIFSLLLVLADDISGRPFDNISLGFRELWNIINSEKRNNISELINDIVTENEDLTNELGLLMEKFGFAPLIPEGNEILSTKIENNFFKWSPNRILSSTYLELNLYSLIFYSEDLSMTYQIENIEDTEYTLTIEDWNNILLLSGETIYWHVQGYNTNEFTTGPYFSRINSISKPNVLNMYLDIEYSDLIPFDEVIWYKFIVPKTGIYEFTTNGSSDTKGELFTSIAADESNDNRLVYDDDSLDSNNFKIVYNLVAGSTVYLRVSTHEGGPIDDHTLKVVCTHHDHEYNYEPVNSQYHILKCNCGETKGEYLMHVIDVNSSSPEGRFKACYYCNAAIDTWDGNIYPVLNNNNNNNIVSLALCNVNEQQSYDWENDEK